VLIDQVGGREHCYLADFGITTKVRESGQGDVSERLLGTLAYVAPEQIRGDAVGPSADVYSLGCLLFECLTGEVPFVHSSDVALIFAHLEEAPPRASTRRSHLPAAVDDVIARALAKDPLARPQTCAELVSEARTALGLDRPARSRAWPALALIAVIATVAVAVVASLIDTGGAGAAPTGSVARIDAATGTVTGSFRVSKHPSAIAAGSRIWVADYLDGALWRVDPVTGAAGRTPAIGYPRGLALLRGMLYVASDGPSLFGGNVTRYDALTGGRIDGVQVVPCSIGAGMGVVYTAGCPYIDRLTTGPGRVRIARKTAIPFPSPTNAGNNRVSLFGIAVGEHAVWVIGDALDHRLFRIAPRTSRLLAAYPLPVAPQAVAAGAGGIWVTSALSGCVVEVDPQSGRVVRTIPTGRGTDGVAVGAGSVWVAAADDDRVTRIDPASGRVTARITVPGAPHAVAVRGGQVWVTLAAR
jgi:streptogramin lyase